MKFEDFVVQELQKLGIRYKIGRKDIVIPCILGHDRRSWSMYIRKSDGIVHCFGCDWSGSWNTFATEVNAAQINPDSDVQFEDPFSLLAEKQREIFNLSDKETSKEMRLEPWAGDWRGMSSDFLKTVPTSIWYDPASVAYGGQCYRAYFPVTVNREKWGYITRRLDEEKHVKYKNSYGLDSLFLLFPYDLLDRTNYLVLVEGPVDALRLLSFGIPAQAILGTNNWSDDKMSLLLSKGVQTVIIAGDGDDAGLKMREKLMTSLDQFFDTRFIPMPEGEDPGSVDEKFLGWIRHWCQQFS